MKKNLSSLVVLTALVAGATIFAFDYPAQKLVPMIGVKTVEGDGWSGGTHYLPMVDGYKSGGGSTSTGGLGGDYQVQSTYQVAASSPGHFFVLAHFQITRNGSSVEVDKALPVQLAYHPSPLNEEKLKQATWRKLDSQLSAFAYMSDSTTYY